MERSKPTKMSAADYYLDKMREQEAAIRQIEEVIGGLPDESAAAIAALRSGKSRHEALRGTFQQSFNEYVQLALESVDAPSFADSLPTHQ